MEPQPDDRTLPVTALERLREELARPIVAGRLPVGAIESTVLDTQVLLRAVSGAAPLTTQLGRNVLQGALPRSFHPVRVGVGVGLTAALTRTGPDRDVLRGVLAGLPVSPSLLGVSSLSRSLAGDAAFGPGISTYLNQHRLVADTLGVLGSSGVFRDLLPHLRVRGIADVSAMGVGMGLLGMSPAVHGLLTANDRYLTTASRDGVLDAGRRLGPLDAGVAGLTAATGLLDLDRASRRRSWPAGVDSAERREAAREIADELWEETESGLVRPWRDGREGVRRRLGDALAGLGRGADAALSTAYDLLDGSTAFLASSVANALIEALDRTLREHDEADVLVYQEAHPRVGDLHEGSPTRRLRARYWLRDADEATQDVALQTVDYAVGLIGSLQRLKHAETARLRTLTALTVAVEAALVALVLDDHEE